MAGKYYLGVPVERTGDRENLRDAALRKAAELAPFPVSEQAVEEERALLVTEFRHRLTYDAMATGQMVCHIHTSRINVFSSFDRS